MTLDADEVYHVDYRKGAVVEWDSRIPSTVHSESARFYALYYRDGCLETIHESWTNSTEITKEDKGT